MSGSQFGAWIRPVSSRTGGALSSLDRQFHGGTEPSPLDIINIDFLGHSPHAYQPENHIIDEKAYWSLVRKATFNEAYAARDATRSDLWGITSDSSYSGINDRVAEGHAPSFGYSLTLIEVQDLRVHVSAEGASFGNNKRNVRGFFSYSQKNYALMITDPAVEARYLAAAVGDKWFDVGRALLCVSLGEPSKGYAYKLIAGMLLP